MTQQLHHTSDAFQKRAHPIVLICDHIGSPANIGSIFRLADSFGVSHIYFIGEHIAIESKRMERTARATHKIVSYDVLPDATSLLPELRGKGYAVVALEITDTSTPIHNYKINQEQPIALILGEENTGVSQELLAQADTSVHINMYGNNSSMNVAMATGIALYELTTQLNHV
ncbi:TrmH family RNA methyltransferase [Aquimarina intermedia]|uniref:SpoU rRNA methylase family protein n=1 Tax=Aquimarina intermedia TaxID=350814 RepID=A0A5S5C4F5_9FLAO|nr:TrmH family RNA methyltransferase [Aquimarina intermedia]TYP74197.1 SpoU rRNA methylase family protein [Aquimarina intermedia]